MESQASEDFTNLQESQQQDVATFPFKVEKIYEPRGDWMLHRLVSATLFLCSQCNKEKKAKLVAKKHNAWNQICCNACYGKVLSVTREVCSNTNNILVQQDLTSIQKSQK